MITQSSDPTALLKITDGLHTNVIPATVKQDTRMFFNSAVEIRSLNYYFSDVFHL